MAEMNLSKNIILNILHDNYPFLSSKYGLKKIGIFGSYARNMQDDKSDIDIIVEFETPIGLKFIEFSEYLEDILQNKIDILTTAGLEGIRNKKIYREIKETIVYV